MSLDGSKWTDIDVQDLLERSERGDPLPVYVAQRAPQDLMDAGGGGDGAAGGAVAGASPGISRAATN
eukprot:254089-Chlamydomonas_euryale.AAC.1